MDETLSRILKLIEERGITDQKKDLEGKIIREQMEIPSFTKEQIQVWLKSFLSGEIDDPEYQRRVLDILVYSVTIFDEEEGIKVVITYKLYPSVSTEHHISNRTEKGSDYMALVNHYLSNPNLYIHQEFLILTVNYLV